MTSSPERPDAARGDQRSPDAMDLELDIRVATLFGRAMGIIGECGWSRNALTRAAEEGTIPEW